MCCCPHETYSQNPILNPVNSLHTLMPYTFDFCCNIILWCTFKSSNVTSPFRFSGWVSRFPHLCYIYHVLVVHLSNFISCRLQTVMLSITQYHPTAFYLLCVCPKYLLITVCMLSLCQLKVREQCHTRVSEVRT